jgi:Lar family restriction alleviation protein
MTSDTPDPHAPDPHAMLPCPFCGHARPVTYLDGRRAVAECRVCNAQVSLPSPADETDAAVAWNTRTPPIDYGIDAVATMVRMVRPLAWGRRAFVEAGRN